MSTVRPISTAAAAVTVSAGLLLATVPMAPSASASTTRTTTVSCPPASEIYVRVNYNPASKLLTKVYKGSKTQWSRSESAKKLVGGNGFQDRDYATGVVVPAPYAKAQKYTVKAKTSVTRAVKSVKASCI